MPTPVTIGPFPVNYTPDSTAALKLTEGGAEFGPYPAAVTQAGSTYSLSATTADSIAVGAISVQPGSWPQPQTNPALFVPVGPPVTGTLLEPQSYLTTGDMSAARGLAGVSADEWPDALVESAPYLGAALAEALRRIPCDWTLLNAASTDSLRLALIYQTAALVVPAANPAKTEDFKVGSFSFKTNDAVLLGDANDLMGWANQYYSEVTLPVGVVPLVRVDAYARPVIRKANTARRGLFGRNCL